MKRVTQGGDINFNVADIKGLGDNYAFRFYTTDSCKYIVKVDGDAVEGIIRLEWDELKTLGDGVLNYSGENLEPDEEYSDATFNRTFGGTTQWYIVTSCSGGGGGSSEEISELSDRLDAEIERSIAVDGQQSDLIAESTVEIHNLGDRLYNDTYTKEEVDRKIAEAEMGGDVPSGVVIDPNYVHTDNNFTTTEKNKLAGLSNYDDTALSNRVTANETAISNTYTKTEVDRKIAEAEMGGDAVLNDGTYEEALEYSQTVTIPFCWLWIDTVNGESINKPIWHIGNSVFVDAAGSVINIETPSVPEPTITGADNGDTVPQNTIITIAPASGCVLHYSLDGGTNYLDSDQAVNITLSTVGSVTIKAYCSKNNVNSQVVTFSVTVSANVVTPPTFEAAQGTTISGTVVSRCGSVVVSVPQGGELHYKLGDDAWQTANGLSVTINIPSNGLTIQAYNLQNNTQSSIITESYTMVALAAPEFTPSSGAIVSGGLVELSQSQNADIYYTTDGSTPTTSSTKYSGQITINTNTTINAIAHDDCGYSELSTATYTIAAQNFRVKTNDACLMTLTKTDNSTIEKNLVNGDNIFTPEDFGISAFADTPFKKIAFSPVANVVEFDGNGIILNDLNSTFLDATNLTTVVGIVLNPSANTDTRYAFKNCKALQEVKISGLSYWCVQMFNGVKADTIDLSEYNIRQNGNFYLQMFYGVQISKLIVGQGFVFPSTITQAPFGTYASSQYITKVRVATANPPSLAGYDWVANLLNYYTNATFEVPSGSRQSYIDDEKWGLYADKITEYNV